MPTSVGIALIVKLQYLPAQVYRYRGSGIVGVQLLRFLPLPDQLYQSRGKEGVVVQLFRLQPFPGHLYQDIGKEVLGYTFQAPAPPWPPVPGQRVRMYYGTPFRLGLHSSILYSHQGSGGVGIHLFRLKPLQLYNIEGWEVIGYKVSMGV